MTMTTTLATRTGQAEETAIARPNDQPVAVIDDACRLGSMAAATPEKVVDLAIQVAQQIGRIVDPQRHIVAIQGRKHLKVEAWLSIAAMLGLTIREVEVVKEDDGQTWRAVVELTRSDGSVVSRASHICSRDEKAWKDRPDFALRSMAMTRATSKCCSMVLRWIAEHAGFAGTPAEEMDHLPNERTRPQQQRRPSPEVVADSPPQRVLGANGAKRLLAKLDTIGKSFDALLTRLRHDDPDAAEQIVGRPIEEIPAPVIPAIHAVIQAWETEQQQHEHHPVPDDNIPF